MLSSASDLNDFLACSHRTALHRDDVLTGAPPPEPDPALEVIAAKGLAHEVAALARYEAAGRRVTRIDVRDGSAAALADAVQRTRTAMQRGDEIIYQPAFVLDGWTGRADFLERVPGTSALGDFVYEIADAKLAVSAKATFLVQLCMYARFVEDVQGVLPPLVHALLGNGAARSYNPARYIAYVDAARDRYGDAMLHLHAQAIPDRIGACGNCAYHERCDNARRGVDHLAFVAGIRGAQIARLREAGIERLAQLAAADPETAPRGIGKDTYRTLVRQARLQAEQRTTGATAYELLAPQEGAGFALLPPNDEAGDVYFDIEGDPLFEPGAGLEYLLGIYTRAGGYQAFWGETRAEERVAFEAFIDWLVAHRRAHPRAHVYHYAPYEKTALRTLAMRHGTREEEVDDLLRGEALVDLYAVVRGAIAQSQESYSIKKLERFYEFHRTADVRKGDDSIVAFERYLVDRDPEIRRAITLYNDEDCVSTARLHEWILFLRDEAQRTFGELPFRAQRDGTASEAALRAHEQRSALEHLLTDGSDDPVRHLLANLLSYHRREHKPVWWALYARYDAAAAGDDFVMSDDEAIGGLELSTEFAPVHPAKKNEKSLYTYTFPAQRQKLQRGSSLRDPYQGHDGPDYEVVEIDDRAQLVRIRHKPNVRPPRALVPGKPLRTQAQEDALARLATAVIEGRAEREFPAAMSLLDRRLPQIDGVTRGERVQPAERDGAIDAADVADLALRLRESVLVVQGPPGTGKTYTGARIIGTLLEHGRRVAVTATGHAAIHNLLAAAEHYAHDRGLIFRGVKKSDVDKQYDSPLESPRIVNVKKNETFAEFDLVSGTSWLMAHEELAPLHVLVVDEAGQVALADAVASATCADAVVLLGDPQQLAHVSLGTHPSGAGVSVLEHLLGDAGTVALERGVFLERSYRMHPDLCDFVSAIMYEGRLSAAPACSQQRIDAPNYAGAGLRYVPVDHAGNAQSSREEAEAVLEIVEGLIGGTFTAADGTVHPLKLSDILIVAPYNAQVALLRRTLRDRFGEDARVGTVDKFQGQEAPAVIYSLAASSAEDAPRGADFLLEENRFNVAVSRGRALAFLVCSPRLPATPCGSIEQLRAAAAFCAYEAAATPIVLGGPTARS